MAQVIEPTVGTDLGGLFEVVVRVRSEDTNGVLAAIEQTVPPRKLIPPHTHENDVWVYVLTASCERHGIRWIPDSPWATSCANATTSCSRPWLGRGGSVSLSDGAGVPRSRRRNRVESHPSATGAAQLAADPRRTGPAGGLVARQ